MQRLLAIAWLTWKAAVRFRLFIVVAVLLVGAVVGLPILIKDDGTARGFTQILLTYTLTSITALLGLSTLWLSCGTLARDIEECQMQMVTVKPIARWQIWIGKWLGIMSLNAALLMISGVSVYALLQWRATKLPAEEQQTLRNEIFVARGSAKEPTYEKEIAAEADKRLKVVMEKNTVTGEEARALKQQVREQIKANLQVVQPGRARFPWRINLGHAKNYLQGQPLYLRVKFNAAEKSPSGTFYVEFQVGEPGKTKYWQSGPLSLASDTFHELEVPPDLFDENGVLTVMARNPNPTTLLFPLSEGMEVLYREGGFGLNFARGLAIILCWMGLLAALGLAAASFLSFPVAAFASLAALIMTFSTGTISTAVEEGTIMGHDSEAGTTGHSPVDIVAIPIFKGVLKVINFAKGFSPIDSLSTGRSITWSELGSAVVQIILVLGGLIAIIGIFAFHRRELATAQGTP
jgi:ABC-type transport system involved in multi-copper enzyme maturation permease subunit